MKRTIVMLIALALILCLVPAPALADDPIPARGTPAFVDYLIDKIDVQTLNDREPVVYARRMYDQLSAANRALVTKLAVLRAAEAKIMELWIDDLYTGDPANPVDMTEGIALWCMYEYYIDSSTTTSVPSSMISQAHLDKLDSMIDHYDNYYLPEYQKDFAIAKGVDKLIDLMDPAVPSEVEATRLAYDSLTPIQKSTVSNYALLKKAEGTDDILPSSIVSTGGRSPTNGNGQSLEQWKYIGDELKVAAPGTRTEHIWIAGMLSGTGINVGVPWASIANADNKYAPPGYEPRTQSEWQNEYHIVFSPNTSRPSHKQFLDYFDANDIYVYLQVENGFADMITLIDMYKDIFDIENHKSVAGFAVDVEWYWAVNEDMGLPVTDARAQEWNEHIYESWGAEKGRIVLKHYDVAHLPRSYRGGETGDGYAPSNKLILCDDAQGFGGLDGAVNGRYGAMHKAGKPGGEFGYATEYMLFSDYFAGNKVVYQIGYANDRSWVYALESPMKDKIFALGDTANLCTEVGIVWVQAGFSDTILFPGLGTNMGSFINTLFGLMISPANPTTSATANLVGARFGNAVGQRGYGPILQDAKYVMLMRKYYNALTDAQKSSVTSANLARLVELEPKALDMLIAHLYGIVKDGGGYKASRDSEYLQQIYDAFTGFTGAQKLAVTKLAEYKELLRLSRFITPGLSVITVRRGGTAAISVAKNFAADVTFESLIPMFATVSPSGVVTGVAVGIAVIRITDPESGLVANVAVNVVN